jgi:hypothetical protein
MGDAMTQLDPSVRLRSEPMTSFQMVAVVICIALNALDGFDILAITFAGPGITKEWALGPGGLGIVISTGLVGMTIGSLGIAPLADTVGRRPTILLCLILMTVGMLLSATADSIMALVLWRVVTGLGIGGMLASINAMVAEYANDERRDFCVGLMAIGYPLGGMLGGMASAWLLAHFDWRVHRVSGHETADKRGESHQRHPCTHAAAADCGVAGACATGAGESLEGVRSHVAGSHRADLRRVFPVHAHLLLRARLDPFHRRYARVPA